VQIAQKLTATY